jgi:hypothetical protein
MVADFIYIFKGCLGRAGERTRDLFISCVFSFHHYFLIFKILKIIKKWLQIFPAIIARNGMRFPHLFRKAEELFERLDKVGI